jgi:GH15 family glucan-1,4-alpha-glucosidase
MPRPLIIGNGSLLVAMDSDLFIRDFTFPRVGLLNHLSGNKIRMGVWVDGRFAWLNDSGWRKSLRYEPNTLVTRAACEHDGLGVSLMVSDCVTHHADILLRRVDVTNHRRGENAESRDIRLFFSHDFHIAETDIGDTVFYHPACDALIHYKRDTYFLLGGAAGGTGLFQYTTGIKGFGGAEGTWRDAEDGWLSLNPVEQGSVDSTHSLRAFAQAGETVAFRAWTCVAHTLGGVTHLHNQVQQVGFDVMRGSTAHFWEAWSRPAHSPERLNRLPAPVADLFRRSLLIMRTQIDNGGAILAANDSDIMETARAHYSYMWPRDGALVAAALDDLGYQELTRRFFLFCRGVLPPDRAALMHKYSADGSWGATWHPWIVNGFPEVPFQQDSTALVLWSLWRHYARYGDLEFLDNLYAAFVVPCGDFLVTYRDEKTGLPLPSYDLWEERRGIHAFTCGTTYGALRACACIARVFAHEERAQTYDRTAEQLQKGIHAHLWDENARRFVRRVTFSPDGHTEHDLTIDSAVYGLWAFGAVAPDDPRMTSTMQITHDRLGVQTSVGGQARYENDYYFRRSDDIGRIPGNPWIICTLWRAQYLIASAKSLADLEPALQILQWAVTHAAESGVLPEQLDPFSAEPLSVSPLTWSHAEFVATVLLYLERYTQLSSL